MARKTREKELTPQEAIDLARKEFSSFWLRSEPLLIGAKDREGHSRAYPLDPAFSERAWALVFIDPNTYSGIAALEQFRELARRYQPHELQFVLITTAGFDFLLEREVLEQLLRIYQIQTIAAIDRDSLLRNAFRIEANASVLLLLDRGSEVLRQDLPNPDGKGELAVQTFLRNHDPGLALLPVQMETPKSFQELRLMPEKMRFTGHWQMQNQCMGSSDPAAAVRMETTFSSLGIVACTTLRGGTPVRARISMDGVNVPDAMAGPDLSMDDDGFTTIELGWPRLYQILVGLAPGRHEITLTFPQADLTPVLFYCAQLAAADRATKQARHS